MRLKAKMTKDKKSSGKFVIVDQKKENFYEDIYNSYLSFGQNKKNPDFEDLPTHDFSDEERLVNLIAFYLPQFHPIPENDTWWERGFTEWANVVKAVPQFVGHYQPHLPGELGFYDLRIPEVQHRQVELAKKFGIFGFCFYYYWFNGKTLLEKPLNQFVSDKLIDFPFCLCWANENWTRRWDGLENDVLISQRHSEDSDFSFIKSIENYLRNVRYIKIFNKPILIVYRPSLLPNPLETTKRWRKYCLERGIGEIYLIAVQSPGTTDPKLIGFDAIVEFPPHGLPNLSQIQNQLKIVNHDFSGAIYDYFHAAAGMMQKIPPEYPIFKTVMTSWDNTARMQNNPLIFHNCTPSRYQRWLSTALDYTVKYSKSDSRFVFINAWNEWAEGTYLEPDRKFGYSYLNATSQALNNNFHSYNRIKEYKKRSQILKNFVKKHDTVVIVHIFYPELWNELRTYLTNLNLDFDLLISIPENLDFLVDQIYEFYPKAVVYRCHNRGRDINPFVQFLREIEKFHYKYICKIHTKKSNHREDGDLWRKSMLDQLLGSNKRIEKIKANLDLSDVGIIGPKDHLLSTESFIGGNQQLINELSEKLNIIYWGEPFRFIAGSMFWCKPEAIKSSIGSLFGGRRFS